MRVRVVSFGFKYGIPVDADLVFDVRFLQNPYFVPQLKDAPGTDHAVEAFVLGQPEALQFLDKITDLCTFVLPRYEREGKSYLTIAMGCTGGRHRSVVLAEQLAKRLGSRVRVHHRDVTKQAPAVLAASMPPDLAAQAAAAESSAELSPLPRSGTSPSFPVKP
jgi:UPF0042 nucleotide-binding protein